MESDSGIDKLSTLDGSETRAKKREDRKPVDTMDPGTWVDQYGDYLYAFALARLVDKIAAEDAVQETFVSALHSIHSKVIIEPLPDKAREHMKHLLSRLDDDKHVH